MQEKGAKPLKNQYGPFFREIEIPRGRKKVLNSIFFQIRISKVV